MVAGPGLEPGALNRDNLRRDAQCGEGDAGGVGEFGKGGGLTWSLIKKQGGKCKNTSEYGKKKY